MTDLTTRFLVCTLCGIFILLGAVVIPYAGVQNDEALFANPLYFLNSKDFSVSVFHYPVVLMVMSYLGTLKTLLYVPIFGVFGVSVWSVRLPMVFAGALTVWVFFHLTQRAADRSTALLAVALLATDPLFLLANTIDWGPVALEHLLLVTACYFLVRFGQAARPAARRNLAAGFFFLGLAMWNKAVFLWALAGVVCGAVAVSWPEIRRALRPPNIALAAAAFLLGASPLVIYNFRRPNATLASNAHFHAPDFSRKLRAVRVTLDGSALLGFITAEDWADGPKTSLSRRGRAALWIRTHLGEHRTDGLAYAFLLALLGAPLWWRSRAARFSLVFVAVAWTSMAFTRDAGEAVHHTVLLWPFPHLFIAAALGSLRWRPVMVLAGVALVVMNLLVVNQYVAELDRNGAEGNFTDALYGLSEALPDPPNRATERPIYVVDWGMINTLGLFHQGRLPLRVASDPFSTDSPTEFEERLISGMFSNPDALFVGHVPAREVISGVSVRLDRAALAARRHKELIRTIYDSNGHPVFEIFHFRPTQGR